MTRTIGLRNVSGYLSTPSRLRHDEKVTRSKASGPVGASTVARCNAVIAVASPHSLPAGDSGRLPVLPAA